MARKPIDGFHLREHGGRLWDRDERSSPDHIFFCDTCGEDVDVLFYSRSTNDINHERRCEKCLPKYTGPECAIPKGQHHPYQFPNGYTWVNGKRVSK